MKIERFVGFLCVAALLLAAAAMVVNAAEKVSVGDFVRMVAGAKGLPAGSASQAARSLGSAGYSLPSLDLNAVLTEGDVVAISKSLGIDVSTSTPGQEFGSDGTSAYFSAFAGDLGTGAEPPEPNPETAGFPNPGTDKGKGKKKGHFKSPNEPE